MFPYDGALLAIVQPTPQTIPDVLRILDAIENTCADNDGLKWFNWLYTQVTQAVETRVAAGQFNDPAWLAELDVQFARLYFSALKSWLSGESTPGCWQVLFNSRNHDLVARIQFALCGINAHINHDLPEAIVATCLARGVILDHGGPNYDDYSALNTTLDSLIDSAKATLNVRLPGDALPPLNNLENTIAAWNVSAAREAAWQNAGHLAELRRVPQLADSFMDMLDGLTTVIGKTLLVPVP
ncbi:MAG TPA: DUF5995 family protein [Bryobacteraceae bacterium]|jgi:hypothetical protein|nr:DUF5995 family protein [Bryobacteraceae bacterium]